jgi:Uma2 family endonuclease
MTVDEFLGWAEGREGRCELQDGELIERKPQRPAHTQAKLEAVEALRGAIRRAGAPCHAMPDGLFVRVSARTAFEPDALVYCGPRLAPDAQEAPDPVIVVEVLSYGTASRDHGVKRAGYFSVPAIAHYLILDPEGRTVIHHRRGESGDVETQVLTDGPLRLEPPGLALFVEELFPPQ